MRRTLRRLCLVVCAAGLGLCATGQDALGAPKQPKRLRKAVGLVTAARDAVGTITAVEFLSDAGRLYHVTLDTNGLALGEQVHGEKARVSGTVVEKGDGAWLTVSRERRLLPYTHLEMTADAEHRRRVRPKACNLCIIMLAKVNARQPKDLSGAAPADGRPFAYRRRIGAWARDERFLWAATDNELFQIDLAGKRPVKSYAASDGLPDQVIHQLLSDGKTLWMVYAGGGVAALTIGQDTIIDVPALTCRFARLVAGKGCVWLVADTGTFRLKAATEKPVGAPALPTAARITRQVVSGIWLPRWHRQTAHFIHAPVSVAGRLYVASYGDVYGLDGATWTRIAAGGSALTAAAGRLWFVSSKGVEEYDPETKKLTVHPFLKTDGVCKHLLATDSGVWVVLEPSGTPKKGFEGGGLARLDLASRTWQTFADINGRKADHVTCLQAVGDSVWLLNVEGEYKTKPAHPGMTYVKRQAFDPAGLCLYRFARTAKKWETIPLGLPTCEKRMIVGDSGARGRDVIVPHTVEAICVGARHVLGLMRLAPPTYFCGYYESVEHLAVRSGAEGKWTAAFEHRPADLGLQGEFPLTLNISNLGQEVLEGLGHDNVLGVFLHGNDHWAVTEGRVGRFDAKAGRWVKVLEPGFRFYWRATAALDDGTFLYVGSDRGIVSRLDLRTGRFEFLTCLNQRSISLIVQDKDGTIVVASKPSPLGIMPVQVRGKLEAKDWTAARFDGKTWTQVDAKAVPSAAPATWTITHGSTKRRWDTTHGNFLCRVTPENPKPVFYLKGVFNPRFLCASPDGNRLWVSTHCGVFRVDAVKKALETAR